MKKSFILKIILHANAFLQCNPPPLPHIIPYGFPIGQSNAGSLLLKELLGAPPIFASSVPSTQNRVPLKVDLIFGKRKKSQGAKSSEYSVCSIIEVPLATK